MIIMMLNMVHWLVGTVNRWLLHDATNNAMQHQHGWLLHEATNMAMQHQHHHQPMNSTKRKCTDPTQWASQSVVHYTTPAVAVRKGQGIKIRIHTETEIHIQRPNYISKDQNMQQNKDQKTWTKFLFNQDEIQEVVSVYDINKLRFIRAVWYSVHPLTPVFEDLILTFIPGPHRNHLSITRTGNAQFTHISKWRNPNLFLFLRFFHDVEPNVYIVTWNQMG